MMEEKGKIKCKKVMESPYNIELESLDHVKTNSILKTLLEIMCSNKSMKFFLFKHNEIIDCLEHNELVALILIRTIHYEKFYKHIPIIASLKKVNFVLIEQNYFNTSEFNSFPYTSHIGIRNLQNDNDICISIFEKIKHLISLINSYYIPINIPYLFNDPSYVNTKFKVEKINSKKYIKKLSRKEKKKMRKSLKKNNI
ncbi:conserved Plasmodium protein, unknown function [Plasmodium gallinaceum]|uniref:Uncharacterized protein n=1 Tax=Plasmodium gallinaceum TaxID=5849 RepID=A0A1J1GWY9_PLAGA|nr:conserved Plasmodium protein, unknown function [Plasmodium gallinaceum]CRG96830.1 conserved Plasmodium protein, unknown function [Plasmodium gallinaceum]